MVFAIIIVALRQNHSMFWRQFRVFPLNQNPAIERLGFGLGNSTGSLPPVAMLILPAAPAEAWVIPSNLGLACGYGRDCCSGPLLAGLLLLATIRAIAVATVAGSRSRTSTCRLGGLRSRRLWR